MSGKDYFRPRGDITTVLDLTDRDSQDNTYFPLNTDESWFHRGDHKTVFPSALSVQEFPQRGPANWGQRFSFEIGSLPAGDLLQAVVLQIQLDSWYNQGFLNELSKGNIKLPDPISNPTQYWTYINSLGRTFGLPWREKHTFITLINLSGILMSFAPPESVNVI